MDLHGFKYIFYQFETRPDSEADLYPQVWSLSHDPWTLHLPLVSIICSDVGLHFVPNLIKIQE